MCHWLDLEALGPPPILPKISPDTELEERASSNSLCFFKADLCVHAQQDSVFALTLSHAQTLCAGIFTPFKILTHTCDQRDAAAAGPGHMVAVATYRVLQLNY